MESTSPASAYPPQTEATTIKHIRKGTKSCIECRQRKIRCTWTSPSDQICSNCKARSRECVPQIYQRRSVNPNKLSSRDRINRLEQQIANLTAVAQDHHQSNLTSTLSPSQEPVSGSEDYSQDDGYDRTNVPGTTPPSHLKFLFDNALIGPSQHNDESAHDLDKARCSTRYLDHAKSRLQRLMPVMRDVHIVAGFAERWMKLYTTLFPSESAIRTSAQLISRYEAMSEEGAHPVLLASFLLTFAITARQIPSEGDGPALPGWKDVSEYVQDVSQTVESTIIANTELASTIEGLETTVMFLRLQLGVGNIRSLWLTLRRTIAIAELIGLPRAWYRSRNDRSIHMLSPRTDSSQAERRRQQKVNLWDAICASDRLSSMMFNLPAATAAHKFPRRDIVSPSGEVMAQPYMFELAGLAMNVQELDEGYTLGQPDDEMYERVLSVERRLRSLKSETPKSWWREDGPDLSAEMLVQYWHYYLMTRVHLHSAMNEDEHGQYSYSRTACKEAAECMARRYATLRPLLPTGFFVCRVVDMQVFTAATFLCLTRLKQLQHEDEVTNEPDDLEHVQQILSTMHAVAGQMGSEFIHEASSAIRSLLALLKDPKLQSIDARSLTLRIPLLGRIKIGRKMPPEAARITPPNQKAPLTVDYSNGLPPTMPAGMPQAEIGLPTSGIHPMQQPMGPPFNPDTSNTLPWLMELDMNPSSLQDPFFYQDPWEFNQGLGFNENIGM